MYTAFLLGLLNLYDPASNPLRVLEYSVEPFSASTR